METYDEVQRQREKYQRKADETGKEQWWRGERFVPAGQVAEPIPEALQIKPGTKTYKVVTQRDEWFMGKFSPDKLEVLLNKLAVEGWRVVAVTTADVGAWFGSFVGNGRQEIVVVMEKDAA